MGGISIDMNRHIPRV